MNNKERRLYFAFGMLAALIMLASTSVAADFRIVDTTQLKAMLDKKQEFTLIDARTKEEFDEAHIVKAVNIQEKTFEQSVSVLPADKNALLVLYCNGVKCGKSKKVAAIAEAAGYLNIMIYGEGFPVWEEKGMPIAAGPGYGKKIETTKLTAQDMKNMIDGGSRDYVIVDVRDESEFREGHIPFAINIPTEAFASRSVILPKEKKVIVYCNSGARSYTAYRKLGKLAYPNIYQTLFADWKAAGYPVEK